MRSHDPVWGADHSLYEAGALSCLEDMEFFSSNQPNLLHSTMPGTLADPPHLSLRDLARHYAEGSSSLMGDVRTRELSRKWGNVRLPAVNLPRFLSPETSNPRCSSVDDHILN